MVLCSRVSVLVDPNMSSMSSESGQRQDVLIFAVGAFFLILLSDGDPSQIEEGNRVIVEPCGLPRSCRSRRRAGRRVKIIARGGGIDGLMAHFRSTWES